MTSLGPTPVDKSFLPDWMRQPWFVVLATVAAMAAFVVPATLIDDQDSVPGGSTSQPISADVKISACDVDDSFTAVRLEVTNSSTVLSRNYLVDVEITDIAGRRVGDRSTWIRSLAPGRSATEDVLVYTSGEAHRCRITRVR